FRSWKLLLAPLGNQPRLWIRGLARATQLEIQAWVAVGIVSHGPYGLARFDSPANRGVDPSQTGQQAMISARMLDDQDEPIAAERPGKKHPARVRRHDHGVGPRLDGEAAGDGAIFVGLAIARHELARGRHRARAFAGGGADRAEIAG